MNDAKQNKNKNNYNSNEHKWNTIEGKIIYLWVCQFDCYGLKGKFVIVDPQQCLNIHPWRLQ
jgi:hypothetical protein